MTEMEKQKHASLGGNEQNTVRDGLFAMKEEEVGGTREPGGWRGCFLGWSSGGETAGMILLLAVEAERTEQTMLPGSILKGRKVTGQREVWGPGTVAVKTGGLI